ncbi:hypothetical protein A3736_01010 [Erythrobacter sp. HI0063]|jgi:hypothetical protein|nr:hypothetical protein A3736_01010 [Erythrobacter sp. HI0063]
MFRIANIRKMPGRPAPAFFVALAAALASSVPASAQQAAPQSSVQPPPSVRPTPGQLELSKLIWSTVAAVDHANRSGNYSVLRDISAQGFQINNTPAQLGQIFAGLRELQIDLSNALLVPPTYTVAPQLVQEDVFRVQGVFQMRPISIGFDLYYQWEQGRWKLVGIDLQPLQMTSQAPSR